jgi:hypothetical protein
MNNIKSDSNNLNELIPQLQKSDKNYANIAKRLKVVYWVLLPVYSLLLIDLLIDKSPFTEILGILSFVCAMLIFALLFRKYQEEYNTVDYALPTLEMLKKAANRYKPFRRETIWALLAALFMDAGLVLNHWGEGDTMVIQLIFGGALLVALLAGLVWWYIRYKPLRDGALQLIREIEGEGE